MTFLDWQHMNEQKTLVPRLRFPEFRNSDEWTYLNGDILFDAISNKNHNSDLPILAITQEHGAIPREDIDYNVFVTDKSVESYTVIQIGDFIISLRSFQGGIEYSKYQGLCSPAYIILRKKSDAVNDFFRHYFKTKIFIDSLNKNIEGIRDGKMVSYKQFSDLLLPIASPREQQKIAGCLSSVDDLITAERQKLEAIKKHKKGLMQQLFPGEGESVPRVRFGEFEDDDEWKEMKLGNIVDIKSGLSPSKYILASRGEYAFLKVEDLNNSDKYQVESREYSNDQENIVPKMSVIFPKRGAAIQLNKVRINLNDVLMDTNLMAVTPNGGIWTEFLYYIILNIGLFRIADTSSIPQINNKHIIPYGVIVPSKPEQQRIADCLSSIDDLITVQGEKVDALKVHKKGLMQQLFPTTSE